MITSDVWLADILWFLHHKLWCNAVSQIAYLSLLNSLQQFTHLLNGSWWLCLLTCHYGVRCTEPVEPSIALLASSRMIIDNELKCMVITWPPCASASDSCPIKVIRYVGMRQLKYRSSCASLRHLTDLDNKNLFSPLLRSFCVPSIFLNLPSIQQWWGISLHYFTCTINFIAHNIFHYGPVIGNNISICTW